MTRERPVLLVCMDAAEISVIEDLCARGALPHLQALRERGAYGPLETTATHMPGSVWPTFYTGKPVASHGIYHNLLWNYEGMRFEMANDRWLPERPFWERLDGDRYRLTLIDVGMMIGEPRPINGVHVSGWATHDEIVKGSWPPPLWGRLEQSFGPPIVPPERFRPHSADELLALRDSLLRATEQLGEMGAHLLGQASWDLAVVGLGTSHRGGHYLWDRSQALDGGDSDVLNALDHALVDIYRACDEAIGRLIQTVGNDARMMVFALHGMGPNPGWQYRLPELLRLIEGRASRGASDAPSRLARLKGALPRGLVQRLKGSLPKNVLNPLMRRWYDHVYDWDRTRVFAISGDQVGYLRVNLKGREAKGIVEPSEHHELCEMLQDALLTYRDLDTDERIVAQVDRADDLAHAGAPYRPLLPDLFVHWTGRTANRSKGVYSDRYGELRWDDGGIYKSGRSGEHRARGWFVAAGEGVLARGAMPESYHIMDLAPTVFQWLDAEPPKGFQGRPIPLSN